MFQKMYPIHYDDNDYGTFDFVELKVGPCFVPVRMQRKRQLTLKAVLDSNNYKAFSYIFVICF